MGILSYELFCSGLGYTRPIWIHLVPPASLKTLMPVMCLDMAACAIRRTQSYGFKAVSRSLIMRSCMASLLLPLHMQILVVLTVHASVQSSLFWSVHVSILPCSCPFFVDCDDACVCAVKPAFA